jgi:hypothetical protein
MRLKELDIKKESTLTFFNKYNGLSREQLDKQLTNDSLLTSWYKEFTQVNYEFCKNYIQYEKAIERISLFSLYIGLMAANGFHLLKRDSTAIHAAITIHQALCSGIRPLWLSPFLTQAFCQSTLPNKITSVKKICPVGILFFPKGYVKNPLGKSLTWVLFYHRVPDDPVKPFNLYGSTNIFTIDNRYPEQLFWFTDLNEGIGFYYSGCKSISVENNQLIKDDGESIFVDLDGTVNKLGIDEQQFTSKVTDLIIQTLLYMQMEKIVLPPLPNFEPLGFGRNSKTKYKKIPPLIIGENYLIKTKREATGESRPHGSPVTHWRSGHWRCQPCGSKDNRDYKTIWIEPMLINKPV